ncbi:MAG: SDR family oxidoreductase [Bacteroidota bacterium]
MGKKIYLITGASRGIGRATVETLAQQANVQVLALARNKEALKELGDTYKNVAVLPFDLSSHDHTEVLNWVQSYGPLNGLMNNAGQLITKPFLELTDADWQLLFAVNVYGPVRLIRTLESTFAPQAHIVNIGSMAGFQGSSKFPGLSAYSASKAAITSFSECLSEEWKDRAISVNCLAFGAVQTEMLAEAFPGYQAPLSSTEMAEYTAWFLQEGGRFFDGKVLPVALNNP